MGILFTTQTVDIWAEPTHVEPYEPSTVSVKVTEDGYPVENISIFFRTDCGYLIDNRSMTYTAVTNENGLASVRFFAEESGTATVTAAEKTGANKTVIVIGTASNSGNGNGGNGSGSGSSSSSGNGGTTPTPTPTAAPGENVTPSPTPTASPIATPTLTPTASPAETPFTPATPSPAPSPTSKPLIPGFEAVFAIAGLLAIAYLVLRIKK